MATAMGSMSLTISGNLTDKSGIEEASTKVYRQVLLNLSAISDFNNFCVKELEVASSATESVELDGVNLANRFGEVTFSKIYAAVINNKGSTDIALSGNLLGLDTEELKIPAGGFTGISFGENGVDVTDTSADTLTVKNISATDDALVELIIFGKQA